MDSLYKRATSTVDVECLCELVESLSSSTPLSEIDLFYLTFMHDSIRFLLGQTDGSTTNCYKKETKFRKKTADNKQSDTTAASPVQKGQQCNPGK